MSIFIIEKLWIDPLENRNACGYDIESYVDTELEAKRIIELEFIESSKHPWPLKYVFGENKQVPVYRYKQIEYWGM